MMHGQKNITCVYVGMYVGR